MNEEFENNKFFQTIVQDQNLTATDKWFTKCHGRIKFIVRFDLFETKRDPETKVYELEFPDNARV